MPWTDAKKEPEYTKVVDIDVTVDINSEKIIYITPHVAKESTVDWLITTLLDNIYDHERVRIVYPNHRSNSKVVLLGCRSAHDFYSVRFFVLKDDEEKVGKDDTIKIILSTDVYPNDKGKFISFFQNLSEIFKRIH